MIVALTSVLLKELSLAASAQNHSAPMFPCTLQGCKVMVRCIRNIPAGTPLLTCYGVQVCVWGGGQQRQLAREVQTHRGLDVPWSKLDAVSGKC